MNDQIERTVRGAVTRLERNDGELKLIDICGQGLTDGDVAELVEVLVARPSIATGVFLGRNRLTDETGVKLAGYLAASSSAVLLTLSDNRLGEATYAAMAAALRVNTSLQALSLFGNQPVDAARIDAAFALALRLNPDRHPESVWWLYQYRSPDDFNRLAQLADQLPHPPLHCLLLAEVLRRQTNSPSTQRRLLL